MGPCISKAAAESVGRNDLIRFFHSGGKPLSQHRIGVEYEIFGALLPAAAPLPFFGSPGVQEILKNISINSFWKKTYENKNLIGLVQEKKSITLEPGGQMELSGTPSKTLREVETELEEYANQLVAAGEPRGVSWLALGIHPFATLEAVPWMPKGRYEILSRHLEKKGTLGHRMMKQTASVQVNLDYENERDAIQKFRLLMGLAPVFTALFANSAIYRGEITPYLSYRAAVWQETDPQRCGLLPQVFSPNFSFEEYVDLILDIPMLFIEREEKWIPVEGLTFRQYLEKGFGGHRATLEDWELHLSAVFPEVRLKQVIELRSVDSHLPERALSVAALVAGLLYSDAARAAAWDLIKNWSWEERLQICRDVPKYGLRTRVKNGTMLSTARELLALSARGLVKRHEEKFLSPVREILEKGETWAEKGIAQFKKSPLQWLEANRIKRMP